MTRELEPWGGELRVPDWIRRMLKRPTPPGDSPERVHEGRRADQPSVSVAANADRAAVGPLSQLGEQGRRHRP